MRAWTWRSSGSRLTLAWKPAQHPLLVEGADAFQAGGLSDAGGLGEGPVGDPCVLLEFGHQDLVDR